MTNTYPRETVEFLEVVVTLDGVPCDTFQVCIAPYRARPSGWAPAVTVAGKRGVMIAGLAPGSYVVWARVPDNPETPVIDCGPIDVS